MSPSRQCAKHPLLFYPPVGILDPFGENPKLKLRICCKIFKNLIEMLIVQDLPPQQLAIPVFYGIYNVCQLASPDFIQAHFGITLFQTQPRIITTHISSTDLVIHKILPSGSAAAVFFCTNV